MSSVIWHRPQSVEVRISELNRRSVMSRALKYFQFVCLLMLCIVFTSKGVVSVLSPRQTSQLSLRVQLNFQWTLTGKGYLWMNPPSHRPPGGWSSTLAAPGVLVCTRGLEGGREGKWDGSHCNCRTRESGSFIKQISFAGCSCTNHCAALSFWLDVR